MTYLRTFALDYALRAQALSIRSGIDPEFDERFEPMPRFLQGADWREMLDAQRLNYEQADLSEFGFRSWLVQNGFSPSEAQAEIDEIKPKRIKNLVATVRDKE